MKYECPKCGCMKKPKTIIYFRPAIAQCLDCSHKDIETNFIKRDISHFTPLPNVEN